jgi:flagellar L-ring protein precursor FlgH
MVSGTICLNGPKGAAHKWFLTPFLLTAALVAGLAGCSVIMPTLTDTPAQKEASASPPAISARTAGSLWHDESPLARLYADNRPSRVGDIVTIKVVEDAKGSKSASTKTSKDSSFENKWAGSIASFFGMSEQAKQFMTPEASMKVTGADKFDGSGATTRADQLTASMTAVVVEVLPNGNLKIQGHREVVINSERQTMEMSGIIRPMDVDSKNVVLSTAIAEAKIAYTGFGVVDDKQHPGLLMRLLSWISPF